jgi:hypothetical protein
VFARHDFRLIGDNAKNIDIQRGSREKAKYAEGGGAATEDLQILGS